MEITRHTAAGDIQAERQLYSGHIFDIVQQTIHTPDA